MQKWISFRECKPEYDKLILIADELGQVYFVVKFMLFQDDVEKIEYFKFINGMDENYNYDSFYEDNNYHWCYIEPISVLDVNKTREYELSETDEKILSCEKIDVTNSKIKNIFNMGTELDSLMVIYSNNNIDKILKIATEIKEKYKDLSLHSYMYRGQHRLIIHVHNTDLPKDEIINNFEDDNLIVLVV